MNENLRRAQERSALLVANAAAQRESLGRNVEVWRRPLSVLDHGLAALRFVGRHPVWIVADAVIPSLLRGKRASSWLKRGFSVLQMVNRRRASRLEKTRVESLA